MYMPVIAYHSRHYTIVHLYGKISNILIPVIDTAANLSFSPPATLTTLSPPQTLKPAVHAKGLDVEGTRYTVQIMMIDTPGSSVFHQLESGTESVCVCPMLPLPLTPLLTPLPTAPPLPPVA